MFTDRKDAGEQLSKRLQSYRGQESIVVGLARGGVVVAKEVANKLSLPCDALVVKKISPINEPELAIGAVAPDNTTFVNYQLTSRLGIDERHIQEEIREKSQLVKQKMQFYRKGKPSFSIRDKTVIIVDDGAATGATATAAVKWMRAKGARRIVLALPVAPTEVVKSLKPEVDELVVLETPGEFSAVGEWYKEFPQIEDTEVIQLLS